MSTGLYSITTRATGTLLTAAIYNADHQNHVTNQNPEETGAYSDNVAQMQVQTSPGAVGTESLAPSLGGELERLRFTIARIAGQTYWYSAPTITATNSAIGINMAPVNTLDITENTNATAAISLLNNSNGTSALAELILSNGTNKFLDALTGTTYSAALLTGGIVGQAAHSFTVGAIPLEFGTNSISALLIDTSQRLLVGYTADQGGGQKVQINGDVIAAHIWGDGSHLTNVGAASSIFGEFGGFDRILRGS